MGKAVTAAGGVTLVAVLVASASAAKAPPSPAIAAKEKRAQVVLAQVNALDIRFGKVVDSWDGARIALAAGRRALATNRLALGRAQRKARAANARLAQRLVAIYENGGSPTLLEVIAGASSLGNLLDRLHAAETVASYDRNLADQAARSATRLAEARVRLRRAEEKQRSVLDTLAAQRRRIGAMLDERRRLLSSIQAEVAALKRREAQRQKALAAAARARLAREQAQARAEAARKAAEAAAATAAKTARAATTQTPTTTQAQTAEPAPTATAETPTPPPATAATTTAIAAPTTTAPTAPTAPVATPSTPLGPGHPEAASIALQYLGVPYRWGGDSPATGFDCSGLVMYVYAQLGILLPHQSAAQYGYGVPVPRDQLQPGDLVFFDDLSHVGIYIGNGEMVHAPQTGDVVSITPLSRYGATRYVGARRLP